MSSIAEVWFFNQGWTPHSFQKKCWSAMAKGKSGLLNAPTGYGKTLALWFGVLENYYANEAAKKNKGLHCLWITPLRALSKEILLATQQVSLDLDLDYQIDLRTGDTPSYQRQKQRKTPPHALVTTPESVHLLLASKGYDKFFGSLEFVIVDEWHELMGSKRGVLMELALAHLKHLNPHLKIWGISASLGNLEQAKSLLTRNSDSVLIRAKLEKKLHMETLYPDQLDKFPVSGHLGLRLIHQVIPLIHSNNTTLIFTNTRSQTEIWYHKLLELEPDLAGQLALHHGSLSQESRLWVEDQLRQARLKAVICTSSLDLGVDFPAVDCVIQIGSPKSIARYLQRAGRSGHQPGALSKIYFLPTHALEIIEGASLRFAVKSGWIEDRIPYVRSFDLLLQFMLTLAVSDGFNPDELYREICTTHCFESVSREEFDSCILLLTQGGQTLTAYDDFHKLILEEGRYLVHSRRIALQHRLSIGAIVSDLVLQVKFKGGKYIGSIEESFISRLKEGTAFWLGGRVLDIIHLKNNQVIVKNSSQKQGQIPSWQGGRLPISSDYGKSIRHMFSKDKKEQLLPYRELEFLRPLFDEQEKRSFLPNENDLLVEYCKTKYGYHLFVYPFEGKLVHEGMAALLAYRIGKKKQITFTMASNDYGLELLASEDFLLPIQDVKQWFSTEELFEDIRQGINVQEMAKRVFRDIASISGLVFTGYPGKNVKTKHLQAHSSLFFSVFEEHEPQNLLFRQAYDEVYDFQLQMQRMYAAFSRFENHQIQLKHLDKLSPFSFPILSESFRTKYSTEDWQARLDKLKAHLDAN